MARPPGSASDTAGIHLLDTARHFGRLLRVIYRHRLLDALGEELRWYVNPFTAHGWGHDALSLVLDSWIVGIQGSTGRRNATSWPNRCRFSGTACPACSRRPLIAMA